MHPPVPVTVTVALAEAVPPAPVQLTEYVVVAVGDTDADPEIAFPVEKFVPVQEVALVEDHASIDACPPVINVGFTVTFAVTPLRGAMMSASCERADSQP